MKHLRNVRAVGVRTGKSLARFSRALLLELFEFFQRSTKMPLLDYLRHLTTPIPPSIETS